MKKEILSRIYFYKYKGNYLNNFKDLISIIKYVSENIDKQPEMVEIGIHLVIESRNHRRSMGYSKAFEMATDISEEIKKETRHLINVLPKDIAQPLTFMNKNLTMLKSQIENNNLETWILFAEPWKFYILETNESATLFINDFENSLKRVVITDEYFNRKIKNYEKSPYEMIYSKINEWNTQNWMKKASL